MADEFNRAVGNWWNSPPTIRTTSSHQPIIHHQLYSRDHENDDHDHMMITGGFLSGTEPSPDFLSTKGSPVGTAFSHSNSSVDSSSHGGNLPSPTFLTPLDSFQGLISSPPASDHQSGFRYIGMPISGCNSSDSFMGWTSSNKIGHDQFTHFLKPSMVEAKPVQTIQPHDQFMNVNRHGSFFSVAPPLLQSPEMAVPTFSDKRKNNMMEARNTSGAGRKSTSGSNRTSTTATASTTSTGSGITTAKRSRNEASSPALPPFKVRKEKMGDRITALQQLVSPFGKTDTASVLSEAIEYIKFLHEQVNVLSTPYLKSGASLQHQQSGHGKFKDEERIARQDLRSQGLCLVPVSSTFPVAHETTVDFWTPTFGPPGGFR